MATEQDRRRNRTKQKQIGERRVCRARDGAAGRKWCGRTGDSVTGQEMVQQDGNGVTEQEMAVRTGMACQGRTKNALPAKAAQECVIKKNTTIQMFVGCGWTLPCIPHTCMSSGSVDDAYPGGWL